MSSKKIKAVLTPRMLHVIDTCVWIDLIEKEPGVLHDLVELVQHGGLDIAVTPTLRSELQPHDPKSVDKQKKNWRSRLGELEQLMDQLSRYEDVFGPEPSVAAQFAPLADKLRSLIDGFEGDYERDRVRELLGSSEVVLINETKDLHELVVRQGASKKKPFGRKNSTADALIFLLFTDGHCATLIVKFVSILLTTTIFQLLQMSLSLILICRTIFRLGRTYTTVLVLGH